MPYYLSAICISISYFILLFLILPTSPCDPDLSSIRYSSNISISQYPKKISYTKACDDLYPKEHLTQCNENDVDIQISSFAKMPYNTNVEIQVKLNISIFIYTDVTQAFLRLECLNAYDINDDYCHNHTKQIKEWGRMIWPCRSVQFKNNSDSHSNIIVPIHFDYNCFPIFSLSTYKLSVALEPQKCLLESIVTIPKYSQLKSEIFHFYNPNERHKWSPLLYVLLNSKDGIWIQYESDPDNYHNVVVIFLYKSIEDNKLKLIYSKVIHSTSIINRFKYYNIEEGNYTIYAFAKDATCETHCNIDNNTTNCVTCPFTILKFTNPEDKFTTSELLKIRCSIILTWLLSILIIICIIIVTYIILTLFFEKVCAKYFFPRSQRHNEVENVQLLDIPEVIIIYSNDFKEHKQAVISLADYLEEYGNCKIRIIDWELYDSTAINPIVSFQSKYTNCIKLIIISETTQKLLTEENNYSKDFVYFKNILELAIYDYANMDYKSWSKKYVLARFNYLKKNSIPSLLISLSKKIYEIPSEIGHVIARLHNYNLSEERVIIDVDSLKYNAMCNTINRVIQTKSKNTNSLNLSTDSIYGETKIDKLPFKLNKEIIPGKYEEYGVIENNNESDNSDEDSITCKYKNDANVKNSLKNNFIVVGSPNDEETDSSLSE
ncbi:SEFIR domain-containing protein [Strongyloides ratti]|uniref:SEFIR domain-containing protein n=1 Tax=Strongyloides ratti TaxID=34506 RepID=A0A090KUR1_STRRB|nr:SEFIR domain-containing protein [Strongyloides ratti]CEF61220.1 SEFIR domain-containing protein [Strongyloides ratti]